MFGWHMRRRCRSIHRAHSTIIISRQWRMGRSKRIQRRKKKTTGIKRNYRQPERSSAPTTNFHKTNRKMAHRVCPIIFRHPKMCTANFRSCFDEINRNAFFGFLFLFAVKMSNEIFRVSKMAAYPVRTQI